MRRDKYEKKLLWYWVDTKYKGLRTEEDKEKLKRSTTLGDGTTSKVPLGLARGATKRGGPPPPTDSEAEESVNDDGEDASASDDENHGESGSEDSSIKKRPRSKPKKSKGKAKRRRSQGDFHEEVPDEAPGAYTCEALMFSFISHHHPKPYIPHPTSL